MGCLLLLALICGSASCAAYSTSTAKQLALYSEITHCSDQQIRSWSCAPFTSQAQALNPTPFQNPDRKTAGFIAYSPSLNAIVVAFRGSQNIQNWITNLDFIRKSYSACSGCSVHAGFDKAYSDVSEGIKGLFLNLKGIYPQAKLMITGHSLGGALAILCAVDFQQSFGNVDLVYTFGQPRVGNDKFAAYYTSIFGSNSFRLINYADTVVHSPPKAFGFLHHGVQVWYSPRGMSSFYICASEDKKCANSISTLFFSTSDHALLDYLKIEVMDSSNTIENLYGSVIHHLNRLYSYLRTLGLSETEMEQLQVEKVEESLGIDLSSK